jgi:hypothetical protein
VAVIVCIPAPRLFVLKDAIPLLSNGIWAREFPPSRKVTMPVGAGDPPATAAVNVTFSPTTDGFDVELSVVVVANAWTFWTRVALAGVKLESPL